MSLLRWHESLLSALAVSFLFREQLRSSFLPSGPSTTNITILPRGSQRDQQVLACSLLILPMCLFVLRPHLWLNLTEMKDADKVPFLNSPVSPTGLFGPAVEGFAERFTAAQKSSQAMRHFLPKHSSSAAALNHPKMAPTQQPAKATPPAVQPPSPSPAAHARPDATHQNSAGLNASGVFLINGTGRRGGKVPLQPDHPSKSLCYAS